LFAHVKAVLARGKKSPTTPIQVVPSRERGYVIGVLSVKGGLGVSTLATNLAISLRLRTKKDVILSEFRPGEGSIALDLGYLSPEGMNRLLQKLPTDLTIADVDAELVLHKSDVRMLLASYNPRDARHQYNADHFENIARHLSYLAHYVVIDLGPGISPITDKTLGLCDELIVVLEPIPHTITRTHALIEDLAGRGFGEGRVDVILYNRHRTEMQFSLAEVQKEFKHAIALVFTAAPELIYQCAKSNVPLVIQHPDNLTSQQFHKLADNITKRVRTR
jgi:pilus assembly protein CpaE